jgi:hypothetical protein
VATLIVPLAAQPVTHSPSSGMYDYASPCLAAAILAGQAPLCGTNFSSKGV